MFNFSRGFCVTSTALGFRGRGSSSSNKGKRKSQDKNAPGMKKNRQGQKQYLEKSAAEGGDHFLYSPEQDMKAATEEVRQQKKEGIQGKNLAMKRAKLYKPAPDDKGAMFKDRIAQMTPEEKLTKQVYLPFGGEEHPRACSILRDVEEMTQLHLEAEKHADDYVSVLRDLVAQATVAKHYVNDGQTVTFFNTMNLLRVALADLGYVVRTPSSSIPPCPSTRSILLLFLPSLRIPILENPQSWFTLITILLVSVSLAGRMRPTRWAGRMVFSRAEESRPKVSLLHG